VLGSQLDLIASRSASADPTPVPTTPAEPLVDPGTLPTESDGPGMAAQTGFSLDEIQSTSDSIPTTAANEQSQGSWAEDDEHDDDYEDHDDDHESDDDHDD
jgi:hypothetical protein